MILLIVDVTQNGKIHMAYLDSDPVSGTSKSISRSGHTQGWFDEDQAGTMGGDLQDLERISQFVFASQQPR